MRVQDLPWPRGEELFEIIRRDTAPHGNKVFLAFSRGKDAIASWLTLRDAGFDVIPYHYYLVPGLGFVERSLAYYEQFFGRRILRVPHPSLYRWLNNFVFQPPEHVETILRAGLPDITYDDIRSSIAADLGLPDSQWLATGVRAADSPQRLMAVRKHGPVRRSQCTFWPVWDMNKAQLIALLKKHGCKLPEEYRYFGRSFDGLDFRFLWSIREHWPDDYERVLKWFPLAELEIIRYDAQAQRRRAAPA